MCGIAGFVSLSGARAADARRILAHMSQMVAHRGPDGSGIWVSADDSAGFAHRRLAVIDLSDRGAQPMLGASGAVIVFNGEIYNHVELREELASHWAFRSTSDTEVILAAYDRWGEACVERLRGMFAFALWDAKRRKLFAARDRCGIKPFYYALARDRLYFASEAKALLPYIDDIATDQDALAEYLTFQYTIGNKTLFKDVFQLPPGHTLSVERGAVRASAYWDVHYDIDSGHDAPFYEERLRELLYESLPLHLRADVRIGAYLSGGIDSSLLAIMAARRSGEAIDVFHGRFAGHAGFDESSYARIAATSAGARLHVLDLTPDRLPELLQKLIWHLDFPVAGPGSIPQFFISELAARSVKVVLGGQGGDEIFGGYARYLLAYLEQCLKAAIDGTYKNGNYVVTFESIVPNLGLLREYKPMIAEFWRDGIFGDLDARYFRLIDRSTDAQEEVNWHALDKQRVFEEFCGIFNGRRNVGHEAYFDKMTYFDFKCLLPALLHVEDRMSMAHGLESRVPYLDHRLVEFMATVPADVKFPGGEAKHLLRRAFRDELPPEIAGRRDKMGFPVPLGAWFSGDLRSFVQDVFRSTAARSRTYLNADALLAGIEGASPFSRKLWGLLSLELWHRSFHDRASELRKASSCGEANAVGREMTQ